MNRMIRSSCNECGSGDLSWMTVGELHDHVPDELKPRVKEGIAMVGADGQAWTCGDCDNFGIMGPVHGSS